MRWNCHGIVAALSQPYQGILIVLSRDWLINFAPKNSLIWWYFILLHFFSAKKILQRTAEMEVTCNLNVYTFKLQMLVLFIF